MKLRTNLGNGISAVDSNVKGLARKLSERPAVLAVSLIFFALAFITLGEFDGLLRGMHVPGRAAAGIGNLNFAGPNEVDNIVEVWLTHSREVGSFPSKEESSFRTGQDISLAFVLVDSFILLPAYLTLLLLLFVWLLRKHDEDSNQQQVNVSVPSSGAAYREIVRNLVQAWWPRALVLLGASDLLENSLLLGVVKEAWGGRVSGPSLVALNAMTLIKWASFICLMLFLVGLLVGVGRSAQDQRTSSRVGIESLTKVRLQLVMFVVFAAAVLVPEQGWDVLRRWDLLTGFLAVVATLLYSCLSWEIGGRLIASSQRREQPIQLSLKWLGIAGFVLVVAGGLARVKQNGLPWGIAVLGGLMLLTAVLSSVVTTRTGAIQSWEADEEQLDTIAKRSSVLTQLLAAGPSVVLGLALVRSSVGQLLYSSEDWIRMTILLITGAILPWVGLGLYNALSRREAGNRMRTKILSVIGIVIPIAVLLSAAFSLDLYLRIARALGTVGLLALFACALTIVVYPLVRLADRVDPPAIFKVLRLNRIPVLALTLIWVLAAAKIDPAHHLDVRLIPSGSKKHVAPRGQTLDSVFDRWLTKHGLPTYTELQGTTEAEPRPAGRTIQAVPMVFVAASGGGIRAGFWTALVLDCVTEKQPAYRFAQRCQDISGRRLDSSASDNIFAASGISGGSVGLISYSAYLMQKEARDMQPDWVKQRLDEDFLAPSIGYQLFVEGPRALLRFDLGRDRAEIMEESWEYAWEDHDGGDLLSLGLQETWKKHPEVPLLLFNGASVNDGCRFLASVLDAGARGPGQNCWSLQPFERAQSPADAERAFGATHDMIDFICRDQDVSLSTAALLSARFPFVSPPGRFTSQCGKQQATDYVVDGGYLDSSAASPLVEFWHAIEARVHSYNRQHPAGSCVVPFFIQIDNGYEIPDVPPKDDNPGDLLAPPKAEGRSRGAWLAGAKQAAAIAFRGPFSAGELTVLKGGWPLSDRYEHIYPRAHPGVQAPLGWVLSKSAQRDLANQVDSYDNLQAIGEVRDWSQGLVTCAPEINSSAYEPSEFDLRLPMDLSDGWLVSDTDASLSLFRSEQDQASGKAANVSITFLENQSPAEVDSFLEEALWRQGVTKHGRAEEAFGGFSAIKHSFEGCVDADLNVEILPTHFVAPTTSCSPPEYREEPDLHEVLDPQSGGGLRFDLLKTEMGESWIVQVEGRTIVVIVTARKTEEELLLRGLASAESLLESVFS